MNAAAALGDVAGFHAIFFEEADEHLAAIEAALLRMDQAPPVADDLNAIFRAAHSIKGTSGMLGFTEIASITHVMENLLDLLRANEREVTRRDIDALLHAGDLVRMQVAFRRGTLSETPDITAARAELLALASAGEAATAAGRRFSVQLGPLAAAVEDAELEMMLSGLAEMGRVQNRVIRNEAGGEICFDVSLSGTGADLKSVLTLVVPPEQVRIEQADALGPQADQPGVVIALANHEPAIEEVALARETEGRCVPDAALELFVTPEAWRKRRTTDKAPEASASQVQRAGRRATDEAVGAMENESRREAERQAALAQSESTSIRVSVEKIDRLVNLVGELVITEAMLAQQAGAANDGGLAGIGDLARHTRNLQEAVMSIRMVPISAVFTRFPRLVRELSQRLGKDVELKVSGETTELDRGLIEGITDPLTHLVRNSIDHGLEVPEFRAAAGKPRCGTISLSASQRGSNIVIRIHDDGRGLDRARILARAAERGMPVSDEMSDDEAWQLIFEPGFSTAESVTDVSGRGVGMDVVRRNIQMLRGTVELASRAGAGTTVTVSVPLTLAIIEAMTVTAGPETYVLPLAAVIESRRVGASEIRAIAGRGRTLRVRDEYLPVLRLADMFPSRKESARGDGIVVIVESDGTRAALLVDQLVGQQQVVVKSLDANFRRVAGIAGATIMGDGKVALILDTAHIIGNAQIATGRAYA